MTIERGLRRIVLALSIAAAVAGGWLDYRDVQVSQWLEVCEKIAPARREFPGRSDVDALALYNEKHSKLYEADGKLLPNQGALAREVAANEVRDVSRCYSLARRILTVGLWGLVPFAAVWSAFFFLKWIVMGFRGVE